MGAYVHGNKSFLSIKTDASRFRRQISLYAKAFKISRDEALKEQWKIVIQRAMGWTPPFNGRSPNNRQQAYKVGRAAVLRDIFRTIDVLKLADIRDANLRALAVSGNAAQFQQVARKMGFIRPGEQVVPFTPALHERQRNNRGRVPRTATRYRILPTDGQQVQAHIGEKIGNIGDTKSGWLPGYAYGGGVAAPWISQHAGRGHGSFSKGDLGDLSATNSARGIRGLQLSRIRQSIRAQTRAMRRAIINANAKAASRAGLT